MSNLATVQNNIQSIGNLIDIMKDLPQVECPVTHRFSDGVYAREIFMPKGSLIVGKIHCTKHLNMIMHGECLVATTLGVMRIKAPFTFESEPGEQKVVYMLSDVLWTTIHVTDKTDLVEIEKDVIAEEYNQELIDGLTKALGEYRWLGMQ